MKRKDKLNIPFRSYYKYILIAIPFILAICLVKFGLLDNNLKNKNYDLPIIQVVNEENQIMRIFPSVNHNKPILDDNFNFSLLLSLIGKEIDYRDFSNNNFGYIDHFIEKNYYQIYDRFDNNIATIYEDDKVLGFTYNYLENKSLNSDSNLSQYLTKEISRIEKIIDKGFTFQKMEGNSKSFVTEQNKFIYVYTITADNLNYTNILQIAQSNENFSLKISVFSNIDSYNKLN